MKATCERCGRIRELFQFTYLDQNKRTIKTMKSRMENGRPFYYEHWENVDESRGLCEECAVEFNKKKYDQENLCS